MAVARYSAQVAVLPTLCGYRHRLRHEEDGVQGEAVARQMLLLRAVQVADWNKELHSEERRRLLRGVLRGEVRHKMHQMQEGNVCWGSHAHK